MTPTSVTNASWKCPGKTWTARTAARSQGLRPEPGPRVTRQASPQAQGIQLPTV